jgi:hypothetical protein
MQRFELDGYTYYSRLGLATHLVVTTPKPQGIGLLGSTASLLASVPEGSAPAFDSGATWRLHGGAISATDARRTDLEPFTQRRITRWNRQGSVVQVRTPVRSIVPRRPFCKV